MRTIDRICRAKEVSELERYRGATWPWYYGEAYRYVYKDVRVMYPIPFNLAYRVINRIWVRILFIASPDIISKTWCEAYGKGFQEGRKRELETAKKIEDKAFSFLSKWEEHMSTRILWPPTEEDKTQ